MPTNSYELHLADEADFGREDCARPIVGEIGIAIWLFGRNKFPGNAEDWREAVKQSVEGLFPYTFCVEIAAFEICHHWIVHVDQLHLQTHKTTQ